MAVVGRISGQLLKPNLTRDGIDLAFETDLLYLSVVDAAQPLKVVGIGVNTNSPQYDLDVNGTTKTTDLEVTGQLDIGNFNITGNTISSDLSTITFAPSGSEPTIFAAKVNIDDIQIIDNVISTEVSNSDLVLRANGSGIIDLDSNTKVTGNLTVTGSINAGGNVTIGGNITIGDSLTDNIEINAGIQSDLIPQTNNTYSLGSSSNRWKDLYTNNLITTVITVGTLNVGDLVLQNNEITTTAGQDLVLDANGAGGVVLGNFKVAGNIITNISSGAVSEFVQTGAGYFKILGTNGVVMPLGTSLEKPSPAIYGILPIGLTRYNTDDKALEIWDGLDWASPAGATGAVSQLEAVDIAAEMALTLG